ncbi:MAG: alpha/beta fold hydrolase [Actinomycetota bacterium]|nr:alpha/beta fold hydrolase [Actinomycetota bacterium]
MSARPGALVLHGLTGSTQSIAGVAAALEAAGFDVEAPMLPGHGTTPEDLAGCRWADWTAAAEEAYRRLTPPVVAVGLSMGAALAAGVCARHPEVRGLAVVNPLIDPPAPDFLQALEGFLAAGERFLPGIGSDTVDRSAKEVAYDRLPVAALLSASRGLAELRRRLGDVRCPVLILSGRHDHVVPSVSGDVLAEAVAGPVERVWLEHSAHVATLDLDREELERRVVAFASELGRAPDGQEEPSRHDAGRGQLR